MHPTADPPILDVISFNNPVNFTDPDGLNTVLSVDPNGAGGNGHTSLYF